VLTVVVVYDVQWINHWLTTTPWTVRCGPPHPLTLLALIMSYISPCIGYVADGIWNYYHFASGSLTAVTIEVDQVPSMLCNPL
jgi:hypothetical protein